MAESLYHHGVKGQQWGVRNGPPYPIDPENHPVHIKQGTKFKRLSLYDESNSAGHAYVNYLKSDSHRYKGFFGARLRKIGGGKDVYSVELEAAKDLMAPSKQERVKTFIELYNEDMTLRKKLGSYHKDDYHDFTPLPRKFYEQQYSNLDSKALSTKGYETFIRAIGDQDPYVRNAYFARLTEKGYHFVTDDMDAGTFGKAPAIIFDRQASTKYKGQSAVSNKEINSIWRQEGTYLKESAKAKEGKSKNKHEARRRQIRKNINDVTDDLTSRNDRIGQASRSIQYNSDFAAKSVQEFVRNKRRTHG